jgi:hypothetical protein
VAPSVSKSKHLIIKKEASLFFGKKEPFLASIFRLTFLPIDLSMEGSWFTYLLITYNERSTYLEMEVYLRNRELKDVVECLFLSPTYPLDLS